MFVPRKGTPGRVLLQTIHRHGPLTIEQGMELHKPFGYYPSRTREVYKRAVDSGWLIEIDGVYSLAPAMKACLDTFPEEDAISAEIAAALTPPPIQPEFRPLSPKHLPSLTPRRADAPPARTIRFFNGGARSEPFAEHGSAGD